MRSRSHSDAFCVIAMRASRSLSMYVSAIVLGTLAASSRSNVEKLTCASWLFRTSETWRSLLTRPIATFSACSSVAVGESPDPNMRLYQLRSACRD